MPPVHGSMDSNPALSGSEGLGVLLLKAHSHDEAKFPEGMTLIPTSGSRL